ncbi:MAG: protein kinase [Pirellulaceae bacterium]|nr:protein kinase [Pirellulaceae bacterium]
MIPDESPSTGSTKTAAMLADLGLPAPADSGSGRQAGSSAGKGPVVGSVGSTGSPTPVVLALGTDSHPPALPDDKTVISQRPPVGDAPPPTLPSSQQLGESLVGKRLEHYDLVEFVGGGGMGAVFRASDTRLGRTVAVKVLSRDHTDEETIRRFRNEAQSAARLDHPNIARVHYVGEASGWNFIVFEFIEGTNLRDVVDQSGPLPLADALSYTLQVAEALAHSSSRDVVHRDIKPSNVLLTAGGKVKLVDMGLARLHQVESSSDDLTASGVTLGTFDYISPEQARDPRSADVRSDIYSLGCTLYYLLVGRPPFSEGTALQKLLQHSQDEPPDVRQFRPDLHPKVGALINKMLAKRPAQRPQTPDDLIAEIIVLANQLGLQEAVRRNHVVIAGPAPRPQFLAQAAQIVLAVVVLVAAIAVLDAYAPRTPAAADVSLRPKFAPTPAPLVGPLPVPAIPDPPLENAGSGSGNDPAPAVTPPVVEPAEPPAEIVPTLTAPGSTNPLVSPVPMPLAGPAAGGIGPPAASAGLGIPPADAAASIVLGPPPAAIAEPSARIRRLVVAPQAPATLPAETEYHVSLAAACQRAAELSLPEVELAWNGPLVEGPLEIATNRLTLRADGGHRPILVFRPQLAGLAGDRPMIRLAGGPTSRLSVQGIELRLELPADPSFGWSLFSLATGQTLELSDCALTVQDGSATTPPMHDQVAMIAVHPRRASDTMTMDMSPAMAAGATISLERCLARGEATFLSLAEDVPLSVRWNQGLLVTPRRLLETTGSSLNPKWFERINLTLDNVTASCRQGLFLMRRRAGAAYQFGLDVTANRCILMTDEESPLYEFIGVSSVSENDLRCEGEFNRYPRASVTFLRIRPATASERPSVFDLEESSAWSMERRRLPGVAWRVPPTFDRPAHAQTTADFALDSAVQADAGFDPSLLPAVGEP